MGSLMDRPDKRRTKGKIPNTKRFENIFGEYTNHAICGIIVVLLIFSLLFLAFFPNANKNIIDIFSKGLW